MLILASASPRRREILEKLGFLFAVVPAQVTENEPLTAQNPKQLVQSNASLKARWIAQRHPDAAVLGADTTVFLGDSVFNKPRDFPDAQAMLRRLSGRTHSVCTAIAVVARGELHELVVDSQVTLRTLDDALISRYFSLCNPLDKAGAYGIQDSGELIVERFTGSLTNIIGLPAEETKQLLTRLGYPPTF